MEFVGIDIGNYKTVIGSSKENGRIYEDEQGKKAIRTVMEVSRPVRKFGNGVTSDVEQMVAVRHRGFRDVLDSHGGLERMTMFVGYLGRVVSQNTPTHPSICMTVPGYFKEKERRMLIGVGNAARVKLEGFVSDICGIGVFACLRRENVPSSFLVFDFGFSKSTAGMFSFEKNTLRPVYVKTEMVGAREFDEKLIDIVVGKYSLECDVVVREKIRRNLDKIKTTLNSTEHCSMQLFLTENPVHITVTQGEYREAVVEYVESLRRFVSCVMEETEFSGVVEVTGGNSSSFLVKEVLEERVKYQATLNGSDSCAIGAALGMACGSLRTKYKMQDMVCREMSVRISGESVDESVKPTVIFKAIDVVGGAAKVVTYNRRSGFSVEVLEDGEVIGTIVITKEESTEAEAVHISLCISRFGTVEVTGVECKSTVEYRYETFGISELEMEELRAAEERYREEEMGLERIGEMRNELETMAVNLGDALYCKFGKIVTECEINTVKEIAMDVFDMGPSSTLKEEEEVRRCVLSRLGFVSEKLSKYCQDVTRELGEYKERIETFKKENPKMFTPSFYKLQGLLYRIDEYVKGLQLDVFNVGGFDGDKVSEIGRDVSKYMKKAVEEVEEKRASERKKVEEAEDERERECEEANKDDGCGDKKGDETAKAAEAG